MTIAEREWPYRLSAGRNALQLVLFPVLAAVGVWMAIQTKYELQLLHVIGLGREGTTLAALGFAGLMLFAGIRAVIWAARSGRHCLRIRRTEFSMPSGMAGGDRVVPFGDVRALEVASAGGGLRRIDVRLSRGSLSIRSEMLPSVEAFDEVRDLLSANWSAAGSDRSR